MNKPKPVLDVDIVGLGIAVPELVDNETYLQRYGPIEHEGKLVTPEWISSMTGVETRGICPDDQSLADLLTDSSLGAIRDAGWEEGTPIDGIYIGTTSAHKYRELPIVHTTVQKRLAEAGYPSDDSIPFNAACASFGYALNDAARSFGSGEVDRVVVVGGDTVQRLVSKTNGATLMMADGAGAIALERTAAGDDETAPGFLTYYQGGDGSLENQLVSDVGMPLDMREGEALARASIRAILGVSDKLLEWSGVSLGQVAIIIPHQPGIRIIEMVQSRLKKKDETAPDKVEVTVDRYGNMSSGCQPVALHEAYRAGRIKPGELVMLATVGAGMNYAGQLIRWGNKQPASI